MNLPHRLRPQSRRGTWQLHIRDGLTARLTLGILERFMVATPPERIKMGEVNL